MTCESLRLFCNARASATRSAIIITCELGLLHASDDSVKRFSLDTKLILCQ